MIIVINVFGIIYYIRDGIIMSIENVCLRKRININRGLVDDT